MPDAKKLLITMGIVILTLKLVNSVPELAAFAYNAEPV